MPITVKFRRGSTAESNNFLGEEGELYIDKDKDTIVVHDGSTVGGFPLASEAYVIDAISDFGTSSFSGDYDDLINKPNLSILSSVSSLQFDTSNTPSTVSLGQLSWNTSDGTLDLGMQNGVVLQVGQETHYVVRNETGSTIQNGTSVYCGGVTAGSGRMTISKMIGDGSIDPVQYLGLVTHDINNGVNGIVTFFGYVRGLDTRGTSNSALSVGDETWAVGDKLYVHPTANGKLTNIEPSAPNTKICVAVIITRHQSLGVLFVRPTTNLKLNKLSDVQLTNIESDDILKYDSSTNSWSNQQLSNVAYSNSYNDLSSKPVITTQWSIVEENGNLLFKYNNVSKMMLTVDGAIRVIDDISAFDTF
jgi:hypothetical protein